MVQHIKTEPVRRVECIEVVKVTVVRGDGTEADPVREVHQLWSTAGTWLGEYDPETYQAPKLDMAKVNE